jgi:hypothetical protein
MLGEHAKTGTDRAGRPRSQQRAQATRLAARIARKLKRTGGATIAGVETWPG